MSGGVIGRPAAGARYVLERVEETGEAVVYRGFVHLPDADRPVVVRVELPGGAPHASLGAGGAAEMEKAAAALVRAATRATVAAGGALPRKIVRWRGWPPRGTRRRDRKGARGARAPGGKQKGEEGLRALLSLRPCALAPSRSSGLGDRARRRSEGFRARLEPC